jgi:hypothetical protein
MQPAEFFKIPEEAERDIFRTFFFISILVEAKGLM